LDVRQLSDVATLAAIVRGLRPFDQTGRLAAAVGMIGGGPFSTRAVPRTPPIPAWAWVDTGVQVLVCLDGILTAADGLGVYVSTLQPLTASGTWRANSGVLGAARAVFREVVQLAAMGPRDWCIVGHSYGGALALVLACLVADAGFASSVQVCTFGSPRPGDTSLSLRLLSFTVRRYMGNDDPVCRFPPTRAEAPVLTLSSGFAAASAWSQYAQPQGGVVLDQEGKATYRPLPPSTLPIVDFQLAGWALSDKGFLRTGHSMQQYQRRVDLGAALPTQQRPGVLSSAARELVLPLTAQAFTEVLPQGASTSSSPLEESTVAQGFVPPVFRAKAELIGGKYVVTWQGAVVLVGHSRSNARSLASALNRFLRVMQGASSADHTDFNASLASHWEVCTQATLGFNPPLVVT
jgi:hypothetical protein